MNIWGWVHETIFTLGTSGDPDAERLAALMQEVPGYLTEEAHAKLDAAIPEAVALAKAAKLPWVELYFRHWELQSRILKRFEGQKALGDAVALVDFAHSDGLRECPQSVCTVQDLGVAYGIVDGPGYAEERRAVAGETLARIDPSWPCFVCISGEYANALVDGGDARGAIAFLDAQEAKLIAAGSNVRGTNLWGDRMQAHLDLGDPEAALEALDAYPEDRSDDIRYALARARVFAELGRFDEARRALPPFAKIEATPAHYERWAETVSYFVAAEEPFPHIPGSSPNTAALSAILERFATVLEEHGAWRVAFETTAIHVRFAAAREATAPLRQAQQRLQRLRGKLRPSRKDATQTQSLPVISATNRLVSSDGGKARPKTPPEEVLAFVDASLEQLRKKMQDAWTSARSEPRTAATAVDELTRRNNGSATDCWKSADERLTFLEVAVRETAHEAPSEAQHRLRTHYGDALLTAGLLEDACIVLAPFLDHLQAAATGEPIDAAILAGCRIYGGVLRAQRDRDENERLAATLIATGSQTAAPNSWASEGHFLRGIFEYATAEQMQPFAYESEMLLGRPESRASYQSQFRGGNREAALLAARASFNAVIAEDDTVINTRRLAAVVANECGDYAGALTYFDAVHEHDEWRHSDVWARILLATRLGEWRKVRESGARLEIDFFEDLPDAIVDENWGLCRLSIPEDLPRLGSEPSDKHQTTEVLALRTGPASARVVSIAPPTKPQFYGSVLLLYPLQQNENEPSETPVYRAVAELIRPLYRYYTVDGVAPTDGAWSDLRQAVSKLGGELQRHSGESYQLTIGDETVGGLYGTLAIPADASSDPALRRAETTASLHAFHTLLLEAEGTDRLVWPDLAAAVGDTETLAIQNARATELGL